MDNDIEIIGMSSVSFEEAIKDAIKNAQSYIKSHKQYRVGDLIKETNNGVIKYKARLVVSKSK